MWLLVPRRADPNSAELWVGFKPDHPGESRSGRRIEIATATGNLLVRDWKELDSCAFASALVKIPASSQEREVQLLVDGERKGSARVSALPSGLATPFRVLLGSCFEPGPDPAEKLARAAMRALDGSRPHVKILCGDQVYLDPFGIFPRRWFRSHEQNALSSYLENWTHPGFQRLLSLGANYFCPDDHELWNDYTVERGAKHSERRDAALRLLEAFQGRTVAEPFAVGPVQFCTLDTRLSRTDPKVEGAKFMDEQRLRAVLEWLDADGGPRVLVLGQPLFGERNYNGRLGSDIPQYRDQFQRLASGIVNAKNSVVILSGDLHFGRVTLGRNKRDKQLVEVIASPLGLSRFRNLAGRARPWRLALETFPGPGLGDACPVCTVSDYKISSPHFATLDFSEGAHPGTVTMEIRSWPLDDLPTIPQGKLVKSCEL